MNLTAEQIRDARSAAELEAFKRFGAELQLKQLPKWIEVRGKVKE